MNRGCMYLLVGKLIILPYETDSTFEFEYSGLSLLVNNRP
jgi:hypothetical protein